MEGVREGGAGALPCSTLEPVSTATLAPPLPRSPAMHVARVSLFPFYFIMVEGSWGERAGQLSTLGCLCSPAPESWPHATVLSVLSQTFTFKGIPVLAFD